MEKRTSRAITLIKQTPKRPPYSKPIGAVTSTSPLFLLSPRPTLLRTSLPLRRLYHFSQGASSRTASLVTGTFIGACVGIYAYSQYAFNEARPPNWNPVPLRFVEQHLECSAQNVGLGRYWTLLTYTFTHLGTGHLLFNMIGLWGFGRTVSMVWGVPAFLALWVGAGVSGGLAGLVLQKRRELKGHAMVGASGSVLGLSAAVACQFPRAKLYIMPFPVPIPSWIVALGFAGWSIYAQTNGLAANTGHLGHLGGMAFGALYWLARLRF